MGWNVYRFRPALLAAALLASALATTVSAQSRDRDPVIAEERDLAAQLQSATLHHGAWYLRSSIELADIGYSEDFYAPTTDQASGVSLGVSAPNRLFYVPSKKVILSGDFTPSYSFVTRSGGRNQFGYAIRGDARFLLNHLYLDFFGSTADHLRANTGEINRILTEKATDFGVAGHFKYSSRSGLTFTGVHRNVDYPSSRLQPEDVDIQLLERNENAVRAAFLHKTFPLTSTELVGDVRQYRFTRSKQKDSRRVFGGAGLLFDSGRTSARLEAGVARLDFQQPGVKEFRGVIGSLGASRRLAARWTGNASIARDVDFSIFDQNNYYILDRATAALDFAATRRLSLRFGSDYGRNLYDLPTASGILRRDRISYTYVGWLYSLRKVRAGFDVGYYDRTSNVDIDEQNGIRVVIHLSFNP